MIVFRKQERLEYPRDEVAKIRRLLALLRSHPCHEKVVEVLIEYGEYESAMTDVLCPEEDSSGPETEMLREAGTLLGRIFFRSWKQQEYSGLLDEAAVALLALERISAGDSICMRFSEGFAHYGIFPETYINAAENFYSALRPVSVTCIGLRSIGTCLSSIVGAALFERGCRTRMFTARPRGHPYDRYTSLSASLKRKLLASGDNDFYLVVDEGPGLSGSSFASLAEELRRLGIRDERIILFPCWEPDGSEFFSETARLSWRRFRKFSSGFEETWRDTGRLGNILHHSEITDISAGNWRRFICAAGDWPALHPHHEQRKYVFQNGSESRLVKFAGLGRYGKVKFSRAQVLAHEGFTPPVELLSNGFIATVFVEGRPLNKKDMSAALITQIALYLAHLKRFHPARPDLNADAMLQMVEFNLSEGLEKEWLQRIRPLMAMKPLLEDEPTDVDGRMLPHEWIAAEKGGFFKTDALDHHTDQFFPKRQDIAWDLAGAAVEFEMDSTQSGLLLDIYEKHSGDRSARAKFGIYEICYLAYRLGYSTLAEESLAGSEEAARFALLKKCYSDQLKNSIMRL